MQEICNAIKKTSKNKKRNFFDSNKNQLTFLDHPVQQKQCYHTRNSYSDKRGPFMESFPIIVFSINAV